MTTDDSRSPVRRPRRNPLRTIGRATFNPRTLPDFEEHRIGGFWRPGVHQFDNWRSVEWRTVFGRYECLDCGERHDLPGPGVALICTKLPGDEAKRRAVGRIEKFIARARGQRPNISSDILSNIAGEIVWWAECYPWGRGILAEYRHHHFLQSYVAALENPPLPDGDNVRPPPNAGEMIYEHLPLVRRLARERASRVFDGKGFLAVDDSLLSDLENVGMQVLEDAVHRFDPTRGVTFGAFVRKRLAGAMDDWLKDERIRFINGAYDMALDGAPVADDRSSSNAPKRYRTSTGGHRETPYISTSARPVRRPDAVSTTRLIRKGVGQEIEAALERLNSRQREVYRGRVLSDPPVPRSVLAMKLGIRDERQIPRIEKQARRKMANFLKVSPP
jgi:RNA polymerase sigma factor (sigma-70 family)